MREEGKKSEIIRLNERSLTEMIVENKDYIYPALFYIAGLLLGAFLFTYSNPLSEMMKSLFSVSATNATSLFFNRFSVYISVYSLTVLLGMCLIGFPFINAIPFFAGVEIAMKVAYYYVNFSIKGIGYSLLMVIPESAAFITILIFTIKTSLALSKNIYNAAIKKSDTSEELNFKTYLKSFVLYAFIIAGIALINTAATYLLSAIIQI